MKLTNNFSLKELTQSQTALRNGLDNTPDEQQIDNLQNICEKIWLILTISIREFYGDYTSSIISDRQKRTSLKGTIGISSY